MTDLREFEQDVREDLSRTAQTVQVPAGAIDRAIRAARAQDLAEPIAVRRSAGWTRPLAAAAAVLLIVSGVALASHWPFADHDTRPTQRPTPTVPAPTTTPAPLGAAKPSPGAPIAQTKTVRLGDASIRLPLDWSARSVVSGYRPDSSSWCLAPSDSTPTLASCPILLSDVEAGQVELDPDSMDGFLSEPPQCGVLARWRLVDDANRPFGDRTADYRRSHINCPGQTVRTIETYVVATAPAFVLNSQDADGRIDQVMETIASTAVVPAQALPLRLCDTGIVKSVVHEADGYHVRLDRVAVGARDINPATYAYVIPDAVVAATAHTMATIRLKVGVMIYLSTDGRHVVSISNASPSL